MSTYTDFKGVTLTAGEEALVSAVGMAGKDGQGILVSIQTDMEHAKIKLGKLSASMGAGGNKDKIDALVTALT
jgi:hypothetical protein